MKVEARDLREAPYDLQVNVPASELELQDPEFRFQDSVTGAIRFRLVNNRVVADGDVATRVGTECVRCLTPITVPIQAHLDAVYENAAELLKPENKAFGNADQQISYFNGESIDPSPEVREVLMLELPTLPVCSETCKGLCPQCGKNLNEGPCDCQKQDANATGWKDALRNINLK